MNSIQSKEIDAFEHIICNLYHNPCYVLLWWCSLMVSQSQLGSFLNLAAEDHQNDDCHKRQHSEKKFRIIEIFQSRPTIIGVSFKFCRSIYTNLNRKKFILNVFNNFFDTNISKALYSVYPRLFLEILNCSRSPRVSDYLACGVPTVPLPFGSKCSVTTLTTPIQVIDRVYEQN